MADAIPVSKQPAAPKEQKQPTETTKKVEPKGVPCTNHDAVRVDH